MRKLNVSDIFKAARILRNGNIISELIEIKNDKEKDQELQGLDVINAILVGVSTEEQEEALYDLLSGVTGKTVDCIKEQSVAELKADLQTIAKENDLIDFFKQAQALTK